VASLSPTSIIILLKALNGKPDNQKLFKDTKVRQTIEWLHSAGVSTIKVGHPKNIAQENGNFSNVHVWTYR